MVSKDFKIYETRIAVYERDLWRCQYPGCTRLNDLQLCHIIPGSLVNILAVKRLWLDLFTEYITTKKAQDILNSPGNLISGCSVHNQLFIKDKQKDYIKNYLIDYKKRGEQHGIL